MIRFIWRIFAATLTCMIITLFVTKVGAALGKGFGMDEGHNMGEVVLAFISGGLIMLIYSRRLDDDLKGK